MYSKGNVYVCLEIVYIFQTKVIDRNSCHKDILLNDKALS